MIQDLNNIFQFSFTATEIVQNLFVALICGLLVSFFYRKSYMGPGFLNSFLNAMVILSMITAIVIMIIGNNLARAFGLVGAMSIIRFRTAVKETQDIIYIFFSLAVGMAAGVGLHKLALLSTLVIGIVSIILSKSNLITPSQKEFLLQFSIAGTGDDGDIKRLLEKYCKSFRLINAKSVNGNKQVEYSYYVSFKKNLSNADFLNELRLIEGIAQINLFFDEESF